MNEQMKVWHENNYPSMRGPLYPTNISIIALKRPTISTVLFRPSFVPWDHPSQFVKAMAIKQKNPNRFCNEMQIFLAQIGAGLLDF